MGIVEKLQHAYNSVKDIKKALNEKGISTDKVPLSFIGDVVRGLDGQGGGNGISITFHDDQRLFWKGKNNNHYDISQTPITNTTPVNLFGDTTPSFANSVVEVVETEEEE